MLAQRLTARIFPGEMIWTILIKQGYITQDGTITQKFWDLSIEEFLSDFGSESWPAYDSYNYLYYLVKDEPRYGCVGSYGCQNFWEDVATFAGEVYSGGGIFASLVDPDSSRFDERYVKKINLLWQYGFIHTWQRWAILGPYIQ